MDYANLGLNGFAVLGPAAKPAIPDLIKVIGRNSNWPESALISIGPDVIPALVSFVATNRTPDEYGDWRRGIPANQARRYAIETLSRFGTNAEAALPVLLSDYHDESRRSEADVSMALAKVGKNHPEKVVPALIELLTNSSPDLRWSAAEGLRMFDREATSAIPALIAAGQSSDPRTQIRAAMAVKSIAPQTADALAPLITCLNNKNKWVHRNAITTLQELGTNGLEALPAMVRLAENDPDKEIRIEAMNFVIGVDSSAVELLSILRPNLSQADESIAGAAINGLSNLAKRLDSRELFLELLFESQTNLNQQVRSIARSGVYEMIVKQPGFLMEPLGDTNVETCSIAMKFLVGFRRDVLVMDRKEPAPSTNFQVYVMKEFSGANKERFRDVIPLIQRRLTDGNTDIRQMATNILIGIDPQAAKDAGVQLVPPYSLYAN